VIMTANAKNTQDELNLIHNYLIPAIKSDKALPENAGLQNELQKRQSSLMLKLATAERLPKTELESKISGKEFDLVNNSNNIQSVYFTFNDEECSFAIKRDDNISVIKARHESWKISGTPLSSFLAPPRAVSKSVDANYKMLQPVVKVGASYSWIDKNTLELTARFLEESLGSEAIVCKFSEVNGNISVIIEPKGGGFMGMPGPAPTPLRGTLIKID